MQELAGNDFKFYNKDDMGNPIFINNLTDTDNVIFSIVTSLNDHNSRIIKSYIGKGENERTSYWSISNLSKLKEYDEIDNEKDFMDTVNQGSGYVIARTDNIDTRLSSFSSIIPNSQQN
ncbi:MAG: hypothetical protein R2685_02625 [Candidatus Nitrosocosmicus sp.]|nr:hypothetical protein [Candidatus Nitrosocosmicus sp.]